MIITTLLSLFGCSNTKSLYTGTFNGQPYELSYRETKGFSTNTINYEVKLGRWKAIKIDALTTDWGPPYADDLYGDARRVYIDRNHTPYSNEPDNAVQHASTMLYLSPSRFSQDAFAQYAAFMQSEWPKIDGKYGHVEYSNFPHIIGLVYGEQHDFVRIFSGKKEGNSYSINIEPDGRIRYAPDKEWSNDEYSGLSEKVQMPGRKVFVKTGKKAGLSLAELQNYKDAAGKTLGDYFTLQESH